ncbi:MAG TPA: S41 family peptidase [Bacteroidales bacterium]|nr:S41 family peptidase [Bacteroidales bacterium]
MNKFQLCLASCLLLVNSAFSQFQMTPATQKMGLAMYAIKNLYVDAVDENTLVEEGLRAMVKKLDPHSAYMTADEMKEMNEPLQGGFDGIGISFNMINDTLFVVEVISGGPSEKVGLLPGDRILMVDKEPIAGVKMANREVMKRLKGPKGTLVTVTVKRRNKPELMDFKIVRDKIPIYSLDASFMVDKKTGYIRLNRFGATTVDEFRQAFDELKKQGMTQLILDLESNGGGYMNAANELADEFLPAKKSIVYTEGLHSPRQDNVATSKGCFENGKLVILIDEYSASASEILSGAIQDWDRGVIVGRRSFGKGLVQRPIPLPDGSMLKLTIARYFTPSGRFIQKPYENAENYSRDVIDRYNRGEMSSADSIHFPDSLRTETLENHRTIYGGGGIMPDVFIAIDTVKYTPLHRLISNTGVMNRFSMKYVDDNRAALSLKYPNIDAFVENFQPDQALTDELMRFALSEKLPLTAADSASDKTLMMRQLKAYMARDLGKSADYFKVTWKDNETLMKAIEIINDKKAYNDLLKRK